MDSAAMLRVETAVTTRAGFQGKVRKAQQTNGIGAGAQGYIFRKHFAISQTPV
jgi:hypothetical protein